MKEIKGEINDLMNKIDAASKQIFENYNKNHQEAQLESKTTESATKSNPRFLERGKDISKSSSNFQFNE